MVSREALISIQANIDMIAHVLPTVPPNERAFYEDCLRGLYQKQADQQRAESSAMAGARQTQQPPQPSYGYNMSPYITQVPSPPQAAEPSHARKRSIGLAAAYPEAKRISGQPSPVTPDSDDSKAWSRQLPSRTSNQDHFVVDLTESDPPTPERSSNELFSEPHPQSRMQALPDPFEELNYAYRDDGQMAPADAFNQDFMPLDELAEFMVAPTAPGGGYGYQQQRTSLNPHAPFNFDAQEVPYLRSAQDSDGEIYGDFPLDVSEADAIEKLFENIKDDGETPEDREPTPRNMTCILKEYQRIGLTWLLKMERGTSKGGILADEMGLGKTIQALALICANPSSNPCCKTTLIIAPVALMRQWEKEIERHIDPRHKLRVHLYHGSGKSADFARLRQFDVVLTTFGCLTSEYKQRESAKESMLREQEQRTPGFRKPRDRLGLLGHECMWYRVIIDEAHNIKNRNAKSSKACAELMAHHRLCMTGTPMNNSIDELYPLLRFLKVEPYLDWPKFSMEVGKPMKSTNPGMRTRALKRVQILLRSIMLRRQKDSTVDGKPISVLPPKHNIIDNVEFEDEEFALYKALETKSQLQMNKYIEKGAVAANYASVLVLLLRLRQACCHPHLIKDLSQPATEGIAEVDLLVRAEELKYDVVVRLKAHDSFECPVCLEADPNPTIIIPCGHTVCGECVQKLIDPTLRPNQDDETSTPKCPHCRGELKAKFITDYKHFCKVHCPERLESAGVEDDEVSVADDMSDFDSDEESDDDSPDVDKKGNLAGFIVDDDEDDQDEADKADDNDSDLGAPAGAKFKSEKKKSKKPKKSSKGKGKERARPKQTLAQLKKESLKNKAAKQRYLRRLDKTYIASAKINRAVELLNEIRKNDPTEKTLIFSQFTSLLDLVEVPLFREKIKYQRYDGSMKMDARADAVNAFMDDPEQNVMLVSIKAGNAGLNLWKASRVIILDPFWNPFIEEQAIDRAHRMPQPREVYVYRILIAETIEDRIKQLQDTKMEVINSALDEKAAKSLTRLGTQELKHLFGMT